MATGVRATGSGVAISARGLTLVYGKTSARKLSNYSERVGWGVGWVPVPRRWRKDFTTKYPMLFAIRARELFLDF